MRRTLPSFAVLCIFLLACSPGEKTATETEKPGLSAVIFADVGFSEALAQAQQENKHVLVDFFSPT